MEEKKYVCKYFELGLGHVRCVKATDGGVFWPYNCGDEIDEWLELMIGTNAENVDWFY